MNIPAWFQPAKEGKYWINCAQLCGNGHYSMKGSITVVSEKEYERWLARNSQTAVPAGGYK
jgi:cytochrome c oxidase subunit 2